MRILLGVEPVDFRKGIDGLASTCKGVLEIDPFSGCLFIFRNKKATAIKILMYDGQGFWLCQKRLSTGRFKWRCGSPNNKGENSLKTLTAQELQQLLWNAAPTPPSAMWKKIPPTHF
jgi:hypothetical protein